MIIRTILILGLAATLSLASGDPSTIVKAKDTELQNFLKKKARTDKENEKIKFLINDIFDFQLLGKKALPVATWKTLDEPSRTSFVTEFRRMVENSSVKKLEVYKADSTRYEPSVLKNDEAKVTAHVWNKGKESILIYKFELVGGVWKAWDLVIDDLSTARNYRDQFSKILETKSFKELLDIIKKKADEGV